MAMYDFTTKSMTEYYSKQKQKYIKLLDKLETTMREHPEELNFLDGISVGEVRGKLFIIDNILTNLNDFSKLEKY